MGLIRLLFRQGNLLGFLEKQRVQDVLARHAPMGDRCSCGEPVNIGDWQAWIDHQYEVVFLAGRRYGPRFLE